MSIDEQPPSRRGVLKAFGVGGALLTAGAVAAPLMGSSGSASARPGQSDDALTDPSYQELMMGVEYVGAVLYGAAVATNKLSDANAAIATRYAANHQQHADTFALNLGADDGSKIPLKELNDSLMTKVQAATSEDAVLKVLLDYENTTTASYQSFIGVLTDPVDAEGFGANLLVNAQQAVVLSITLGQDLASYVPAVEPETGALDPADYATDLSSVVTTTTSG